MTEPENAVRRVSRLLLLFLSALNALPALAQTDTLRVATFNVEDVRTDALLTGDDPRCKQLAEVIQRIRPNVILLNEIAYDTPGAPDVPPGEDPGQNARRFVEHYLAVPQAPGLQPLQFEAFMAPSNTGMPSGFDLDHSGDIVTDFENPSPENQTDAGRAYGGDCWGFGAFPGQYAMALLVDSRLTIETDDIRTFQLLPWDYMPGAALPTEPDPEEPNSSKPWYTDDQRRYLRLSSKSHWDVPVELPSGRTIHFLCSHPTPPAFDGPEMRNKKRNHDEIRFWADYLANEPYIVDDNNHPGGIARAEPFVILGDLNADPDEGTSYKNPIKLFLLTNDRLAQPPAPTADVQIKGLDPDDTAHFGLRADYILPSRGTEVLQSGVWRTNPAGATSFPSDHFPVWTDLRFPEPPAIKKKSS